MSTLLRLTKHRNMIPHLQNVNFAESKGRKVKVKSGKKKPEKTRAATGFELVASANTGAMLYQLNYEALAIHTLGAPPMRG